ncbi:MAG: hypothetical protein KKD11_03000 [Candidatus Omnitrophica bacterium]|nr:hypothetical protein [Candidatus Omnitrophota bacterium]
MLLRVSSIQHRGSNFEIPYNKIPRDRIKKDKECKLWIQIESMQRGGKRKTFKFDIENLAELLLEE